MISCWECGFEQASGTLFCNECGAYLLAADEIGHVVAGERPFLPQTAASGELKLVGQELEQRSAVRWLHFIIPVSARRVVVPLHDQVTIGRSDPDSAHQPELDLAPDGGAELGVSRRHAVIQRAGEGIVLVDMNSTNGTLLNDSRLPPELPYRLSSGAEIRFGSLLVHVFFE